MVKTKRHKPLLGFTIDADVAAWIRKTAKRGRKTMSAVVQEILVSSMEKEESDDKKSSSGRGGAVQPPKPDPLHAIRTKQTFQRQVLGIFKRAGVERRHTAMRHSFASYYLAATGNAPKTAAMLGHWTRTDTLFAHYRRLATPQAAREYFAIIPRQSVNIQSTEIRRKK